MSKTSWSSAPERQFPQHFKRRREEQGLSLVEVSKLLEGYGLRLDPTALTRLEKGQRGIKLDEAVALSNIVETPLQALISGPENWAGKASRDFLGGAYVEINALHRYLAERHDALTRLEVDDDEDQLREHLRREMHASRAQADRDRAAVEPTIVDLSDDEDEVAPGPRRVKGQADGQHHQAP